MRKRLISLICAAAMAAGFIPAASASEGETLFIDFDENSTGFDLMGGAQITEDGKSGSALLLDGNESWAQLAAGLVSDEMTISAWVRQDKRQTWGRVFDFGADSSSNFFFAPYSGGASRVETKTASATDTMDADELTETGVWAYYTVTVSGRGIRLYRAGRLVSEKTDVSAAVSDVEDTLNYIGKSHYDTDAYFAGAIDDFKVYNRVLDADEIAADMSASLDAGDRAELLSVYGSAVADGGLILGDSVELPKAELGDISLYWTSSDEAAVNPDTGAVTHGEEAKEVILTLNAESASAGDVESASFTVKLPAAGTAPFTVTIDGSDRSRDVSDNMWGLFFEDINSAADGGLYAQLVQNLSFEYPESLFSWTYTDGVSVSSENPLNENNTVYAVMGAGDELENDGYFGMSVDKDALYDFSIYTSGDFAGNITVTLKDADGTELAAAEIEKSAESTDWTKEEAVLTSAADSSAAALTISADGEGELCIDMVSLMPQDTYKGHGLRRDMMEALEALHPKFLRFPGGCAVEGQTMATAYNWKDTVGDVSERKNTVNIWNPSASEYYDMSYGLGFYEYFVMCEDLGMEPVPILNCGMACQVRSGSSTAEEYMVPLDELEPYIQDALDLIEFANGTDMTNEWAKLRADMGHPEPFNLKYIGIGNEQYGSDYFARYELFAEAIREAYPDMEINLVTTSGTASSGASNDLAWSWVNENNELADIVDEHYYETADWFRSHAYRYDNYSRDTAKVFLGEYASKGNLWYNALSEAAFMTGLERNSDVVRMASYAPMFAKYENTQWSAANMIWFNNDTVVLTPNYYVQSLFSNNTGDYSLDTKTETTGMDDNVFSGGVAVGTWKTQAEYSGLTVTYSDGTVLFNDGFDSAKWSKPTGEWTSAADGSIAQSSDAEGAVCFVSGDDWEDYTLTLKAKKTGGNEGFLIGVCAADADNMYWVNIGGWSNTATKFQKVTDGTASTIANVAECDTVSDFSVENDVWYDIKVVVEDDKLTAYVNDAEVASTTLKKEYGPVCASSVYDAESGEIIIKAVNTADYDTTVHFDIENTGYITPEASVTVMAGDTSAANTLSAPDTIVPYETQITNASSCFDYEIKADSLNVIRIKTGNANIIVSSASEAELEEIISGTEINVTAEGIEDGYTVICVLYDSDGIMRAEFTGEDSATVSTIGISGFMRVYAQSAETGLMYCREYTIR